MRRHAGISGMAPIFPKRSTVTARRRAASILLEERTMLEGLFQPMHLLVIFGIALLMFGPKKLPELGKGIGDGIRGFKSAMREPEEPSAKTGATEAEKKS